MYLAVGATVQDAFRHRSGGEVRALRPAAPVGWVDVTWPDGTLSTYSREAAQEFLEVERPARGDLFKMGEDI